MSKAIEDVVNERQRQQPAEGYTTDRDDNYKTNEMTAAAVAYVSHVVGRSWVHPDRLDDYQDGSCPSIWPWDEKY